jgi:hypothetical protein
MLAITMINTFGLLTANMCLKTVMFTCSKSLNLMRSISYDDVNHYEELNKMLIKTDIKQKIAKIHKLLMDLEKQELKDCVKMAINDLHYTIQSINTILEHCIDLNQNHKQLWLHQYRTLKIDEPLSQLKLQIKLLNIRFEDLYKIINIIHYTNGQHNL